MVICPIRKYSDESQGVVAGIGRFTKPINGPFCTSEDVGHDAHLGRALVIDVLVDANGVYRQAPRAVLISKMAQCRRKIRCDNVLAAVQDDFGGWIFGA